MPFLNPQNRRSESANREIAERNRAKSRWVLFQIEYKDLSIVQFQLLSKSSGLESPGLAPQTGRISRSGAPDREDLSIVRFQLLSKSSGLESPGLAP